VAVAEFVRVAALEEVTPGQLLSVEVGDVKICLANVEGEIYAVQDNCSHKDFPLSNGELDDTQIECSWHGARFDLETGRALCLPAIKPVKTYEVKIDAGEIYLAV
jgi:3-phenylpropionate/trans-cinnamate dioxygenase ferredoxin subunit